MDVWIRGGMVADGSLSEPRRADVLVRNGTIVDIGCFTLVQARQIIEARGKVVAPGFLDMHRHADAEVFRNGFGTWELMQGITTIVNANCGLGIVPIFGKDREEIRRYLAPIVGEIGTIPTTSLKEYFTALSSRPMPIHTAMLAGGGTLRASVVGFQPGALEPEQERQIQKGFESMLADGALGVSMGLGYAPECHYSTKDLERVLEPIRNTGTVLSVHLRGEATKLLPSVEEVLELARTLRVPLQISHLKAVGKRNWNWLAEQVLDRIQKARESGTDVMLDIYPYTAGSTQLSQVLPPEVRTGDTETVAKRLADPAVQRYVAARIENDNDFDNFAGLAGWENIILSGGETEGGASYSGRSVLEACNGVDPAGFVCELLARERCNVSMIDFITCEEDIERILRHPLSYVTSDATYPTEGEPHPRVCGAFSKVLRHYVRERKCLTLTEAIHSMTQKPADRYGLKNKGRIAVGADADLLVFDPDRVSDTATFAQPQSPAKGMETVLVHGIPAVLNGKQTGACGGSVIRKTY